MTLTAQLVEELEARGFRWHPREEWLPRASHPWLPAPSFPDGDVDEGIVHWPGASSLSADVAGYMARTHDSTAGRPSGAYSFMYNFVVSGDDVWEGRGVEFKNAANSGSKVSANVNDWTLSVCVYQPIGHGASNRECEAAAVIFAVALCDIESPHSKYEWTECCGDVMRVQIENDLFNIARWPAEEPEPPPEPEPEEPDMLNPSVYVPASEVAAKYGGNPPWFYRNEWGRWGYADNSIAAEVPGRGELNLEQYEHVHLEVFGWPPSGPDR